MRIVVMSDSHGNSETIMKIVERNAYTADMFVHLGDGEIDTWRALQKYPNVKFCKVRGNCDETSLCPDYQVIDTIVNGDNELVKIFATHGHMYHVNHDMSELVNAAKSNGCSIAIFGHTHRKYDAVVDGVRLINPGSCACPHDGNICTYVYIDISLWGIIVGVESLE